MKNLGALLRPFGLFALLLLAALSLSRALLVIWQFDRVTAAAMLGPIFLQGVRFDLILLGYFLVCLGAPVFLEVSSMAYEEKLYRLPKAATRATVAER